MFFSLFNIIFSPLVLTILIESLIWFFMRSFFEKKSFPYFFLLIVAVNLFTNPSLNFSLSLLDPFRQLFLLEILFEILVVFVEAFIFYIVYKKEFGRLFLISFILNIVSYGIGLILFSPF